MRTYLRLTAVALAGVGLVAATMHGVGAQESGPSTGQNNAITDVPGVEVGHFDKAGDGFLTGTSVILTRDGAVGGVDVSGGGPGTRETDLLDPGNLVNRVHSIVLSGGSAYGLDAAHGTMLWLEEQEIGYPVGFSSDQIVPIVPAAILFDLGRGGEFTARPDHDFGYNAAANAAGGPVATGNVGAGMGASAGGLKGGFGTASIDLGDGIMVGAAVAINAAGRPFNPATCELYGAYLEIGDEFGDLTAPTPEDCQDSGFGGSAASTTTEGANSLNTTIGVVATNLPLTKALAGKMAAVAHDGMARGIRPVHTQFDGDTIFALSTGQGQITSECVSAAVFPVDAVCTIVLNDIIQAAADAFTRAIVHAMIDAETTAGITAYCDEFPTACGEETGSGTDGGGSSTEPPPGEGGGTPGDSPLPVPTPVTGGGLGVGALLIAAAVLVRRRRRGASDGGVAIHAAG